MNASPLPMMIFTRYLSRLWSAIGFSVRDKPLRDKNVALAKSLRRLLKDCPVCRGHFSNHSYTLFVTTVLGKDEESHAVEFFQALKEQRWRDSLEFQTWQGLRDNAEPFALRCSTASVAMMVVRSPFELFDSNELLAFDVLDTRSGHELLSFIDENCWKPL